MTFTPTNGEGAAKWVVKDAEFKGFVKESLDNIKAEIVEMKEDYYRDQEKTSTKIEKNRSDIESFKLKVIGFASVIGGVAGFIGAFVRGQL